MKLIVANWKLNPAKAKDAQNLAKSFEKAKTKYKIVLCPPSIYLPLIKTKFDLGVQDIFWQESGAYTGAISASMAKEFKVKWAIIGHSERRTMGETDADINLKLKAALANKIQPILCVGYGIEEVDSTEEVFEHLQAQLKKDLDGVDTSKVVVAYEPVWAIGSGKPATPEHAEKVAMFIKIKFKVKKVLYGGSTNAQNAKSFLAKDIDGLLVGGASLKPDQFKEIIK